MQADKLLQPGHGPHHARDPVKGPLANARILRMARQPDPIFLGDRHNAAQESVDSFPEVVGAEWAVVGNLLPCCLQPLNLNGINRARPGLRRAQFLILK